MSEAIFHGELPPVKTSEPAIAKLKAEMEANKNNPMIQVVGDFLLQHLDHNPGAAGKLSDPNKTITKSLEEMRKVAQARQVKNMAVLSDPEGFAIVLKYFGIDAAAQVTYTPQAGPVKTNTAADFNIKLDDLL